MSHMQIADGDLPLQRIWRWEQERADHVFLTQPLGGKVREWTWRQAVGEARRMAAYLKAQHWEAGSPVAILSKNCAWWIMADMAIWMAGHVSVPIYPSLRAQTIRQILDHSGAKACFVGATEREAVGVCGQPGLIWITLPTAAGADSEIGWESLVEANVPIAGAPVRPGDDLATIIYTSGTTGAPKGVMHRFAGFAHNARVLTSMLGLREPQRVLSYLPLAHILERAGSEATSFFLGNRMYFTEGIETFLEDLERARPTIFLAVPRLLLKFQQGVFAKLPSEKLDRLLRMPVVQRYVRGRVLRQLGLNCVTLAACGGAPLPAEVLLWYRRLGLRLGEGYGMTETMITHLPQPDEVRPGYVGRAIEGLETRVTAEGELLIRSPMNMIGYFREPELTAAAFTEDGFFRTGDVVTVEPDGQTKIVGRIKEQFKTSKGKYVAPAPIESMLMEHPGIEACCLMGAGQPSPFAVILLSDIVRDRCLDPVERAAVERTLAERLEGINAELDPFERLSRIVIADGPWTIGNGFMTPTLKIRRNAVEEHYRNLIDEWESRPGPVIWESEPPLARSSQSPSDIALTAKTQPRP
jgi:long-chain acyl-CoA synthetase